MEITIYTFPFPRQLDLHDVFLVAGDGVQPVAVRVGGEIWGQFVGTDRWRTFAVSLIVLEGFY